MSKSLESIEQGKMIDTDPSRIIISGLVVIFVFFGGLGLWAAVSPFSGAVIAPGAFKGAQERVVVQHLEGGIVDQLFVQEGSQVAAGDLLLRLESTSVHASVDMIQGQLAAKLAEEARLRAENRSDAKITWPEELLKRQSETAVAQSLAKETEIFLFQAADLRGKLKLITSQIRQLEEQIAGLEEELAANEKVIDVLKEESLAKQTLYEERYIDMSQILDLRRRLAEREGARGRLRQTVAATKQHIEELKLRSIDLKNSQRTKAANQIALVTDEVFSLRERLRPALDSQERLEIRAPVSGEVLSLNVHSEDAGVVRPGEPILEIVPKDTELIIESRIQTKDINDVSVGQSTNVQLLAFDRNDVAPVQGEVIYVSADQLQMQTPTGEQGYYIVHVRILPEELAKYNVQLLSGMPAVCFINTAERTVLGYLLEPLFYFLDRALRES